MIKNCVQTFTGLLDLFLQSNCPLCQRPTSETLCPDCQRQIRHCQMQDTSEFWQEPLPVFPWGVYRGTLKRAIAALKYENQPILARPLGHWMGQSWLQSSIAKPKSLVVVPIPMYAEKKRQRGYDQAERLATYFCEVTGLPLIQQGLERIRATEAQFTLSLAAREQNLSGAFQVGRSLLRRRSATVLLLDDVYTTGATVRSAVHALRQQNIPVCGLVALAKPLVDRQQAMDVKRSP